MTEYKCVNFSELCRLCASSNGPRMGIYTDEGRKKRIHNKIIESLRISINESDRLPKSVCMTCLKQVETHEEFRATVVEAQGMLQSCLQSRSLENDGKVYIRDVKAKEPTQVVGRTQATGVVQIIPPVSVATNRAPSQLKIVSAQTQHQQPQQQRQHPVRQQAPQQISTAPILINSIPKSVVHTVNGSTVSTVSSVASIPPTVSLTAIPSSVRTSNADFLGSIIQAVGIKSDGDGTRTVVAAQQPQQHQQQHQQQQQQQSQQPQILTIHNPNQPNQQYTIKFDGQTTIQSNNTHYKLENGALVPVSSKPVETQPQTTFTQVDEFIKIKANPAKVVKREPPANLTNEVTPVKRKRIIQIVKHSTPSQVSPSKSSTVGNITIESPSATGGIVTTTPTVSSGAIVCTSSNAGTIYTNTLQEAKPKTYMLPEVKLLPTGNKGLVPFVVKNDSPVTGSGQTNGLPSLSMTGQGVQQNAVQLLHVKLEPGPDGVMRLAPLQNAPLQTAVPQYAMATIATTGGQQIANMPPMTILAQNQPMVQAQVGGSNYVTLVGKTSSQTQTVGDESALQHQQGVVMATVHSSPSAQQPVQQQQQIQIQQIQTIKKPQQTPMPPLQVQQRTVVANNVPKTGQRIISTPRKVVPPQPTSNPPKLAHAATAPKTFVVNNRQSGTIKGNSNAAATAGVKTSTMPGRAGHHTTPNGNARSSLNNSTESRTSNTSADLDSSGPESAECEANRTAQSLMASQQMSAISAMSSKLDPLASDQQANTTTNEDGTNGGSRAGGDVSITTCDVCRKTFGRKEHLVQHLKSHIGLRPFKCEEPNCNKSFSRKEHLLRHTVSHTGHKMFNCDKCNKLFSRKDNLNKHRKTHTEPAGVSPYSCNICNKDFYARNQFLKHKAMHDSNEETQGGPKLSIKKDSPVVKTEMKQAGNSATLLESTVIAKPSQPPPLAHTPVASIVTSDAPHPTNVVQSVPLTITHMPSSTATIQLPTICASQQQVHQLIQQQHHHHQQHTHTQNGTTSAPQQIFTIPAHIPTANGKPIIQHLQIALQNNVTGQTISTAASSSSVTGSVQTLSTAQGATLASLGGNRATIINSVDGNPVFTLPSNFIFDTSQIITASRQS